jgi:ubiquinone/menaquinone biosynthesis C-methylase UbiE
MADATSPSHASAFSATAVAYQRTMTPALRPLAERVVALAALQPGERVLDIGTGTGTAAALAVGDGRQVTGVDAAPGMLAIGRALYPGIEFVEADFMAMPFDADAFGAALSVHALHFAQDRIAALREWRRVVRPGGRIVFSIPGPPATTWIPIIQPLYEAHGIGEAVTMFPEVVELTATAREAGWSAIEISQDPDNALVLADDDAYRDWLVVGARGRATAGWSDEQRAAFERELAAILPRDGAGRYRLPFGAFFVTARA